MLAELFGSNGRPRWLGLTFNFLLSFMFVIIHGLQTKLLEMTRLSHWCRIIIQSTMLLSPSFADWSSFVTQWNSESQVVLTWLKYKVIHCDAWESIETIEKLLYYIWVKKHSRARRLLEIKGSATDAEPVVPQDDQSILGHHGDSSTSRVARAALTENR